VRVCVVERVVLPASSGCHCVRVLVCWCGVLVQVWCGVQVWCAGVVCRCGVQFVFNGEFINTSAFDEIHYWKCSITTCAYNNIHVLNSHVQLK